MHELRVAVGPAAFRLASPWKAPIAQLDALYRDYPRPDHADFTVRLDPAGRLRRWLRPSALVSGDYWLPDAAPLPAAQGLLGLEMGMNLQMALGWRQHLLLHAGTVEKDGRVLILTGESGAGKSTLSAMLGEAGWRFMGDEFALLGLDDGLLHPFPRPVSLKNQAIAAMEGAVDASRFGPLLTGTPKGDIRHLSPRADALARMAEPARPALILFPRYGAPHAVRGVERDELFMRLTQASTNYVTLGEPGFDALLRLVRGVPALALDYESGAEGLAAVEDLWSALP